MTPLFSTLRTLPCPTLRQRTEGRDEVYVAAVPLTAPRGPAQVLVSAAYSLGVWNLQHFMVIIKPRSLQNQPFVYDFQPRDPENFYEGFAALSGKQVPGVVLKRSLKRLPKIRCWFVGVSVHNGIEVANKFSEGWSTELVVGKHDCRHYTNGLVKNLTGERDVLARLSSTFTS
ncbi:hypothetical protein HPP92_022801 [Vanilla planifolia]|uniref:Uncharacterized protein n=1 Tax=Vanilla planifolia TaxID=51239 RepID=A0A835UC93_VANPL|nr:hypothetical protein HPP92_022801 [Vanilla planifolia]